MGAIGFMSPIVLIGLLALPIVWWLLRAVPPAAVKRRFPAVSLLLGLQDKEITPIKTPWWLLVLRTLALTAIIVGFSGPILNPNSTLPTRKPLLIALDAGWASGANWADRVEKIQETLGNADRTGRPVAVIRLTEMPRDGGQLQFGGARREFESIKGLKPSPFAPQFDMWLAALSASETDAFDTRWFSDGLNGGGRAELLAYFQSQGEVLILQQDPAQLRAIKPPRVETGQLSIDVIRAIGGPKQTVTVDFIGPDPAGISRSLASATSEIETGKIQVTVNVDLPSELRNRVKRVELRDQRSAGATQLTDDSLQRRKVALMAPMDAQENNTLTTPLHYLRKALVPTADVIEAPLADVILANANVIILSDVGTLTQSDAQVLENWVQEGGLLVRFAGPRMAASNLGRSEELALLPVRLRAGGRSVGGAMSWGEPKRLRAFGETSPFFGLKIPDDVTIQSQVLAQPGSITGKPRIGEPWGWNAVGDRQGTGAWACGVVSRYFKC